LGLRKFFYRDWGLGARDWKKALYAGDGRGCMGGAKMKGKG
jgi:hypothetical protein